MTKTVKKVFFAWQIEKEKAWLEEMARKGYILTKVKPFRYTFEITESRDLVYQFDFQIINKRNREEYIELFDSWTIATHYGAWYYFYKEKEGEELDRIYSDNKSRKEMFRRILGFLLISGFPLYYQLLVMFPNLDPSQLEFPKFYSIFRIILYIVFSLHLYAVINVLLIYRTYFKVIKE